MNLYGHVVKSLTDSDDEDAWIIEGLASSPGLDLQGDIIPPEAFDLQYFLGKKLLDKSVTKHRVKKPWVDWNHGFELAEEDDPDLIAGEPIDAKVTPEGLMVRLKLYKNHLGSEIRRNMEQFTKFGWPRRYGLSVSGLAQRDPNNLARIKRFIATSVAITPRPVNPETWAEIAKAATIRDSVCLKALEQYGQQDPRTWKSVVREFRLTPAEEQFLRPVAARRLKALMTSSISGNAVQVQDLEDVLHNLSWHFRDWKRLHPYDPHLSWDGYFDTLDAVRDHLKYCEQLPYRDVAEVVSMLAGSALVGGPHNIL